ncbi:MAG TPA: hypothetical protein VLF18_12545 [Tahibacter sp.]|uniref:hypothetical protein n=1 Tax=Tahibacter sp. TaxID=2056211 RepID=UPI002CBA62EB|nr:hypothetical protein [Tahibacter sp.]HSX61024.1 hypothetical protein [Tahibacter sp.]
MPVFVAADLRAVARFAVRRVVDFFAAGRRAVDFFVADLRAVVFFAVDFRAVGLRAVAFFAVDFRAADCRAVDFLAVDFFAVAFFAALLRVLRLGCLAFGPGFAPPSCLLTVAQARRSASFFDTPRAS